MIRTSNEVLGELNDKDRRNRSKVIEACVENRRGDNNIYYVTVEPRCEKEEGKIQNMVGGNKSLQRRLDRKANHYTDSKGGFNCEIMIENLFIICCSAFVILVLFCIFKTLMHRMGSCFGTDLIDSRPARERYQPVTARNEDAKPSRRHPADTTRRQTDNSKKTRESLPSKSSIGVASEGATLIKRKQEPTRNKTSGFVETSFHISKDARSDMLPNNATRSAKSHPEQVERTARQATQSANEVCLSTRPVPITPSERAMLVKRTVVNIQQLKRSSVVEAPQKETSTSVEPAEFATLSSRGVFSKSTATRVDVMANRDFAHPVDNEMKYDNGSSTSRRVENQLGAGSTSVAPDIDFKESNKLPQRAVIVLHRVDPLTAENSITGEFLSDKATYVNSNYDIQRAPEANVNMGNYIPDSQPKRIVERPEQHKNIAAHQKTINVSSNHLNLTLPKTNESRGKDITQPGSHSNGCSADSQPKEIVEQPKQDKNIAAQKITIKTSVDHVNLTLPIKNESRGKDITQPGSHSTGCSADSQPKEIVEQPKQDKNIAAHKKTIKLSVDHVNLTLPITNESRGKDITQPGPHSTRCSADSQPEGIVERNHQDKNIAAQKITIKTNVDHVNLTLPIKNESQGKDITQPWPHNTRCSADSQPEGIVERNEQDKNIAAPNITIKTNVDHVNLTLPIKNESRGKHITQPGPHSTRCSADSQPKRIVERSEQDENITAHQKIIEVSPAHLILHISKQIGSIEKDFTQPVLQNVIDDFTQPFGHQSIPEGTTERGQKRPNEETQDTVESEIQIVDAAAEKQIGEVFDGYSPTKSERHTENQLTVILKKAEPFRKKIVEFEQLKDSTEYYYIDESLQRLGVYEYIFQLFRELDEKLEENIQNKETESASIVHD
ncbi:uncharacterized protein LOC132699558 [Cylas formicarius]|uniref:uncharacterized protein LOC132699558 n=1 Tax=Cylas formicarius TaxID=197179 RepID=UPI002958996B|nr:uncharacterized protein LOC132699558 [Cylas formicarius]